jgi:hypothetical protein
VPEAFDNDVIAAIQAANHPEPDPGASLADSLCPGLRDVGLSGLAPQFRNPQFPSQASSTGFLFRKMAKRARASCEAGAFRGRIREGSLDWLRHPEKYRGKGVRL